MKFVKNLQGTATTAGKFVGKAAITVVVGFAGLKAARKVAEKSPVEVDDRVLDTLYPK
jgi:hypothetical protein